MVRMSVFTLEYYTFWITQFLCFLIYDKNTGLNKAKITIKNSDNKGISFLCKPHKMLFIRSLQFKNVTQSDWF